MQRPRRLLEPRSIVGVALLFLWTMPAARPAHALSTIYDHASPEAILALADAAFHGQVIGISTRHPPTHTTIVTDYQVEIHEIVYDPNGLLNAFRAGGVTTLTFAGGTLDGASMWIPGVPTFAIGDESVFLIQKENLGSVSPLVGANRGLYRIRREGGRAVTYDSSNHAVERGFFAGQRSTSPMALSAFLTELRSALPRAKADSSLLLPFKEPVPRAARNKVFRGPQIPRTNRDRRREAVGGGPSSPMEVRAGPGEPDNAQERLYAAPSPTSPEGDDPRAVPPPTGYAFLWGPPDIPSVFNIPPVLYGNPNIGQAVEFAFSNWVRYASGVFLKYTTPDNVFGHNGRNDFAIVNDATFTSVYGFSPPAGWLGYAALFNFFGLPILPGFKIYESDIVLSSSPAWTIDFRTSYDNTNIWYFPMTVLHEIGHCIGRQHQFDEDPSALSHSVMNYVPSGPVNAEFGQIFADDAVSIRAAYPANAVAITDYAVHLFRSSGDGAGPVEVFWSTFPAAVQAGQSFTISNFIIENLGTTTVQPVVDWYLTTLQHSYDGIDYFLGSTTHASLAPVSQFNTSRALTVPAAVPPGSYFLSSYSGSDGWNGNRAAWSNLRITVTAAPTPSPSPTPTPTPTRSPSPTPSPTRTPTPTPTPSPSPTPTPVPTASPMPTLPSDAVGLDFFGVAPCRLVDTRLSGNIPGGTLGGPAISPAGERSFSAVGRCGIPADAGAIAVNLAVVSPTAAGFLTLYPSGYARPLASSVNFPVGGVTNNNGFVPLSSGGAASFNIYNGAPGSTHVVVDVTGYFS